MNKTKQSGMEVVSDTGPQIPPTPDAKKYYAGPEKSHDHAPNEPILPLLPSTGNHSPHKAFWTFAVITVLCMAVASGAGLGAGLATHRKSNSLVYV